MLQISQIEPIARYSQKDSEEIASKKVKLQQYRIELVERLEVNSVQKNQIVEKLELFQDKIQKIDTRLKNGHLARVTKANLIKSKAKLIEIKLSHEMKLIQCNEEYSKYMKMLQTVNKTILEISLPKLELRPITLKLKGNTETKSEEKSVESDLTIQPKPEREVRKVTPKKDPPSFFLFDTIQAFAYMQLLEAKNAFIKKFTLKNLVYSGTFLLTSALISYGISKAIPSLFGKAAPSLSLLTSAEQASTTVTPSDHELRNLYWSKQSEIKKYIKDQGHSLDWCLKHGPKISLELYNWIIEKGKMKKWW